MRFAGGIAAFVAGCSGDDNVFTGTISAGFHHVVWVYSTTPAKKSVVYIEGQNVANNSRVTHAPNAPVASFRVGTGENVGSGFVGSLDEIAIYAHALVDDRIKAHFSMGSVGR